MDILQPHTRTVQIGSDSIRLLISTLANNNSEVTVTAYYQQKTFSQYFRREDFKFRSGESLLFLKLLLEETEFNERTVFTLSDQNLRLDNVIVGRDNVIKSIDSYKKITGEELKGLALFIKYEGFECLLQLPVRIARSQSRSVLTNLEQPEIIDAQELSYRYLVESLEKQFIEGRI